MCLRSLQMNREIMPSMLERNFGHVVAMSSLSSMCGVSGISSYTATKWSTNGKPILIRVLHIVSSRNHDTVVVIVAQSYGLVTLFTISNLNRRKRVWTRFLFFAAYWTHANNNAHQNTVRLVFCTVIQLV